MKTNKRVSKALLVSLAVMAMLTISLSVLAGANRVDRSDRRARVINATPPVGITAGQTLHITYLNTGDDPFEIIPCVFDARGDEVKESTRITLAPGQFVSFDVSWSDLANRGERRVQLRAVAHINNRDIKHLSVNAEVVDDESGKSTLYVPGSRAGFDPQPDPPSPN